MSGWKNVIVASEGNTADVLSETQISREELRRRLGDSRSPL